MSNAEGNYQDGRKEADSPGTADKAPIVSSKPKPPSHSTAGFLIIDVLKGASIEHIVKAVEVALRAEDVPFLPGAPRPHNPPAAGAQSTEKVAYSPATSPTNGYPCQHDTLLMLLRQEGWP
jgi:hypothetical protein